MLCCSNVHFSDLLIVTYIMCLFLEMYTFVIFSFLRILCAFLYSNVHFSDLLIVTYIISLFYSNAISVIFSFLRILYVFFCSSVMCISHIYACTVLPNFCELLIQYVTCTYSMYSTVLFSFLRVYCSF